MQLYLFASRSIAFGEAHIRILDLSRFKEEQTSALSLFLRTRQGKRGPIPPVYRLYEDPAIIPHVLRRHESGGRACKGIRLFIVHREPNVLHGANREDGDGHVCTQRGGELLYCRYDGESSIIDHL
jgi:hypothetical protein